MVNALTSNAKELQINVIDQFLHGYADGHRLIEGSLKLPDDLSRLMLRMSDLSGTSVVNGFEKYITGYPLDSINAYALAMTWYAPEMPRPGCVWTHTLAIPAQAMASIPALSSLTYFFKRPKSKSIKGQYADPLPVNISQRIAQRKEPDIKRKLGTIFAAYYGQDRCSPLVLVARDSDEFSDAIFALWSQQWPSLRQKLAFCTGSLSARKFHDRPFDIQCSPPSAAGDVVREVGPENRSAPLLVSDRQNFLWEDLIFAVNDALIPDGGRFRQFLWNVAGADSKRSDFLSYAKVFDAFHKQDGAHSLIELIARLFPEPNEGVMLKKRLLGTARKDELGDEIGKPNLLRALATTSQYASFDSSAVLNDELIAGILKESRRSGRQLISELFRSNLNPLGDDLLRKLICAMNPEDARQVVFEQPQLLPALFIVNPDLAASSELWSVAGDRKRELFDALVTLEIRPDLVSQIVFALLDSGSDVFIRRAFGRWGKNAVFGALDWTESHQGSMSENCRSALTFQVPDVVAWIESGTKSAEALTAVAHVVASYPHEIARHDSTVWLTTLRSLQESGQHEEATFIRTFVLALGLCNALPEPLDLIAESFEIIHREAEKQRLRDNAWMILQPLVPELIWWNNWDKCERMRRALLIAFMRYSWPAWEITERVKDREILRQTLGSVYKVDAEQYFRDI